MSFFNYFEDSILKLGPVTAALLSSRRKQKVGLVGRWSWDALGRFSRPEAYLGGLKCGKWGPDEVWRAARAADLGRDLNCRGCEHQLVSCYQQPGAAVWVLPGGEAPPATLSVEYLKSLSPCILGGLATTQNACKQFIFTEQIIAYV